VKIRNRIDSIPREFLADIEKTYPYINHNKIQDVICYRMGSVALTTLYFDLERPTSLPFDTVVVLSTLLIGLRMLHINNIRRNLENKRKNLKLCTKVDAHLIGEK
jgi:hypothetical protein